MPNGHQIDARYFGELKFVHCTYIRKCQVSVSSFGGGYTATSEVDVAKHGGTINPELLSAKTALRGEEVHATREPPVWQYTMIYTKDCLLYTSTTFKEKEIAVS